MLRSPRLSRSASLATLAFLNANAYAHHSFSLYSDDVSEVEGRIVSVDWRNPHVRLILQTANGDLTLEGAAGYILQRRGISREMFSPGDRLRAAGRTHRRDPSLVWLHNILLESGAELLMIGGVELRWADESIGSDEELVLADTRIEDRGIFRVWSRPFLRPISYGEGLPYRRPPPQGGDEWIERLNGYARRCDPVGMPGIMATPYPFEFTEAGAAIELRGFSNNAPLVRRIEMQSPPQSGGSVEPGRMGRSIGHWEDSNELVVETSDINWPYFDDSNGTVLSNGATVTEYFSLSEDQARLSYRMVVTDNELFTEPATVIEVDWVALEEELVQSTECSN